MRGRWLAVAVAVVLGSVALILSGCGAGDGAPSTGETPLGQELYDRGEFQEAIEVLTAAVESDPDDVASRKTLALALAATGDVEGAVAQYGEVVARDADDHETLYRLGIYERQIGMAAEAAEHMGAAAELDPDDASYWDEYARTLSQLGRYEEAAEAWGRILGLDDIDEANRKSILVMQGEAYVSAKLMDEAAASYETAIEVDPSDQNLVDRLAQIRGEPPDG